MQPCQLTATDAAALIRDRKLSTEELVRSCLHRIAARDPVVRAWLFLDPDMAIRRARELDKLALAQPVAALHGLPWGVKDIIDTLDQPTTHNSPIYPDVRTNRDAACVSIVRSQGGVILGKTDTVEFASGGRKALSRNPFNPAHTPGGSSSGSGAAVGDFHVPLAFGTQTGGSHIRPAAFNGIYGIKPTWGLVSREGVRMSSMTLDTVGWYGRCVDDLIMVARGFRLPASAGPSVPGPEGLRVGLCRSPAWPAIEPAGADALMLAASRLRDAGAIVEEYTLPDAFNRLLEAHADIVQTEGGVSFLPEYLSSHALLAPDLRGKVENERGVTPERLLASYALADACRPAFDRLFGHGLDVILTPSAPGEAPEGLHTTGNAIFQSMWTLLHVPCVAIPVGRGPRGLPVGVQLVGPRMTDMRLLAMARALAPAIDTDPKAALRELWN